MGGLFSSSKKQPEPEQPKVKKVEVNESEIVIAKMKLQEDKLNSRVRKLDREKAAVDQRIRQLVGEKKKEEAYYQLKKLKEIKEMQKNAQKKLEFIEKQIQSVEDAIDDVRFTSVIKDSNRAIEQLNKEIDMEELRIAKDLQQEGKIRREELNQLLEDGDEDSLQIQQELDRIESEMVSQEFANNPIHTTPSYEPVERVPQQQFGEQRRAMLN